jgi:CTLH/CRA C-terminal to LisH motif domain
VKTSLCLVDKIVILLCIFCSEGFKEAAEKFAHEAGIKAPAELEHLDERIKIRDAIQAGRIQEATALVNQLHPDLLDSDRYLFFHLQQQHLIELIRHKNIEEALRFAQVGINLYLIWTDKSKLEFNRNTWLKEESTILPSL